MAPSDYIQARSITTSPDDNDKKAEDYVTIIDGYPYMPFLKLDPNDTASIQEVAAKILSLATSSLSTTTEEDDEDDKERTTLTTTNIDPNTLSVDVVIGGITNKLFKVSGIKHKPPGSNPDNDSVLIRVFGGHGLIDRDVETSTHAALAKTHIAVPYLGRFENGRIEDWCENMPPLSSTQLADVTVSTQIALSLANLHSKFQVPWELQPYHDPNQTPTLWSQLESWWNQAIESTTTPTNGHSSALIQSLQELELERFSTEVFWLRETVIDAEHAKVGFCHNDLLAANILYCPDTETIQLVDFEYGGINYMAYDIANHFNEYAGGTTTEDNGHSDYTKFPSRERQRNFVQVYLQTIKANKGEDGDGDDEVSDQEIDELLKEIKGFVLANHIVWGLWAVNQSIAEGCDDFDYLQYAKCRLGQYWIEKEEIMNS